MDNLIAFLRDRITEDEAAIRTWAACCIHIDACDETGGYLERFDTRRMLAEVEAKRRILDWCERMAHVDGYGGLMARDARMIRRLLAQPYAEHPDYRPEWRP